MGQWLAILARVYFCTAWGWPHPGSSLCPTGSFLVSPAEWRRQWGRTGRARPLLFLVAQLWSPTVFIEGTTYSWGDWGRRQRLWARGTGASLTHSGAGGARNHSPGLRKRWQHGRGRSWLMSGAWVLVPLMPPGPLCKGSLHRSSASPSHL